MKQSVFKGKSTGSRQRQLRSGTRGTDSARRQNRLPLRAHLTRLVLGMVVSHEGHAARAAELLEVERESGVASKSLAVL